MFFYAFPDISVLTEQAPAEEAERISSVSDILPASSLFFLFFLIIKECFSAVLFQLVELIDDQIVLDLDVGPLHSG